MASFRLATILDTASDQPQTERVLFLIGGAPRCGKSLLADELLVEVSAAPIHTDNLISQIRRASPRLLTTRKIHPKFDVRDRTNHMLPSMLKDARDMLMLHEHVVMEGELISPRHVNQFKEMFGKSNVHAAFLIASKPDLEIILKHEGKPGWLSREPTKRHQQFIEWFSERERICTKEAKDNHQKTFDISPDFDQAFSAARHHLIGY